MVEAEGSTNSSPSFRKRAKTIRTVEDSLIRGHLELFGSAITKLSAEQLASILIGAYPVDYDRCDYKYLTERTARVISLMRGTDDAIDESTPAANKRQKLDETLDAGGQNSILNLRAASTSSMSDSTEVEESESDEFDGGDRRELKENGEDGWRDGSGNNSPMFKDLFGSSIHEKMIDELKREVIIPLQQLKLLRHFGIEPKTKILLHGPPGCGKTMLARAIANEAGVPFREISAAALASGVSGEPEVDIEELFSTAHLRAPSIVFIDEIDAMTSNTESLQKVVDPHIVKQLIACMDKPHRLFKPVNHDADSDSSKGRPGYVLVIGATNCPDALDPALRRWFDREIAIAAPDEQARLDILSTLTPNLKFEVGFDLAKIAKCTLGFVAGDLVALVKEAGKVALSRTMDRIILQSHKEQSVEVLKDSYSQPFLDEDLENLNITMKDFMDAGCVVQPSSGIERFRLHYKPFVNWDDVVGLQLLKSEFERHIIKPIKFRKIYEALALQADVRIKTKFFLYGPTGCGKSLIVEALANETGANLMCIQARNLKEYGDQSGWVVRNLFRYAQTCSPCILFFDELTGGPDTDDGQWPDVRQLLQEIDGIDGYLPDVYVIASTNCVEVGELFPLIQNHFDKILCVHLPTPKERGAILKLLAQDKPIDAEVDVVAIGKSPKCRNYNGDDLSFLMKETVRAAIRRGGGCREPLTIKNADFEDTFLGMTTEVTQQEKKKYKRYYALCESIYELEKDDTIGC